MSLNVRGIATVVALAIGFLAVDTACAQNVIAARLDGQPLVYMKDGKISGCGVRFILVDAPANLRADSVVSTYDLSFNVYLSGAVIVKGGSSDATVAQFKSGDARKAERPIALTTLWLKADGAAATQPLDGMKKSDDVGFVLYESPLDPVSALFGAVARSEPILVGTKRPGAKSERLFGGAIAMDRSERDRVANCVAEMVSDPKK